MKKRSSECKKNIKKEWAGTNWQEVDCQIAKGRSEKEDWPKRICQKVKKQLCEDDQPWKICQNIKKQLYEDI